MNIIKEMEERQFIVFEPKINESYYYDQKFFKIYKILKFRDLKNSCYLQSFHNPLYLQLFNKDILKSGHVQFVWLNYDYDIVNFEEIFNLALPEFQEFLFYNLDKFDI